MSVRKLPDGTIEADSPEEMRSYFDEKTEEDLRSISFTADEKGGRGGFITPLLCFLPIKDRNWILTPLACFYRPSSKR